MLIEQVAVFDFRSLQQDAFSCGPLTALVGANGSGKSNFLRALNLFFNGEVEPGVSVQPGRDFHKPWRPVRDRSIQVEVSFALPPEFSIHTRLKSSLASVGIREGGRFKLTRGWVPDPLREGVLEERMWIQRAGGNWRRLDAKGIRAATRFLQLIHFRYVPNHIHPSDLLRAESGAVQQALIVALKASRSRRRPESRTDFDAVLKEMADAARAVADPITETLSKSTPHLEALELTTPTDWTDVAWSFGIQLRTAESRSFDLDLHGSGHQTYLAYLLLAFLDTRFGQRFGWHQATIWALEEPESFLHHDLENQLSLFLREQCESPRFQAFITTHRLLFAAAADMSHEVTLVAGATETSEMDVLELADRTLASGTSTFVHPLNLTQPKPTLLVDGPLDVFFLTEAYKRSGRTNPWDIRSLESLDPSLTSSGKENVKKYVKANQGPLRARPTSSPVIALLDWEDTEDDEAAVQQYLSVHPTSRAIRWRVAEANPDLGDTFRGIERFLATALIGDAARRNDGILHSARGLYQLLPQKSSSAKQAIRAACQRRRRADDLAIVIANLDWLESFLPA